MRWWLPLRGNENLAGDEPMNDPEMYGERLYDAMCLLAESGCEAIYLEELDYRVLDMAVQKRKWYGTSEPEIENVVMMPAKIPCLQHKLGLRIHFAYSMKDRTPKQGKDKP